MWYDQVMGFFTIRGYPVSNGLRLPEQDINSEKWPKSHQTVGKTLDICTSSQL